MTTDDPRRPLPVTAAVALLVIGSLSWSNLDKADLIILKDFTKSLQLVARCMLGDVFGLFDQIRNRRREEIGARLL